MRVLARLALVAVAFSVACTDFTPTDPGAAPGAPSSFGISDGAHDDGINVSNDDFFFLSPLVKDPTGIANFKDDPFHATIRPHVEICLLQANLSACEGAPIRTFGPDELDGGSEAYSVNWDTKEFALDTERFYRISVFVKSTRLGYADVNPVETGRELRNINTDEYIGLVDGRTLPIRFRIEHGALCTVDPCTELVLDKATGGTVIAADKGAGIQIGEDALPVDDVLITIERLPVPPGSLCVTDPSATSVVWRQWEGCYEIRSDPDLADFGGFTKDVIAAVCIDPAVPEDLLRHLQLIKFDEDRGAQRLESVPALFLECEGFTATPGSDPGPIGMLDRAMRGLAGVTNRIGRFIAPRPLYAVDGGLGGIIRASDALSTFFWGLPVTASISAGNDQEAPVNSPVPISPAVLVETAHADVDHELHAVSAAPVTFSVTGGGGALVDPGNVEHTAISVVTDAAGIATLPTGWTWRLGDDPEVANTLVASGPFDNGSITFTATALPVGDEPFVTLLTGLHYPTGLWLQGNGVFLTETAGHNTIFGGNDRLLRYDLGTDQASVLLAAPDNNDAVVVTGDGTIYLTSYNGSTPGQSGSVSVAQFDPEGQQWVESPLAELAIASRDMYLDANNDLYVIGSSDLAGAASLYLLPFPDYAEGLTVLRTGLGRAVSLTKVGSTIFYSTVLAREVRRFDGESDTPFITNVSVLSLTSDGIWLYYADFQAGLIGRRHLTTGATETVLGDLNHPSAVRYDFRTGRLYFLEGGTQEAEFKDGRLRYISVAPPPIP